MQVNNVKMYIEPNLARKMFAKEDVHKVMKYGQRAFH
jgi:hypothetical protein